MLVTCFSPRTRSAKHVQAPPNMRRAKVTQADPKFGAQPRLALCAERASSPINFNFKCLQSSAWLRLNVRMSARDWDSETQTLPSKPQGLFACKLQAVPVRRRQDLPYLASSRRPSSLPRSGREAEASKPNRKWLNTMARNNCYVLVFLTLASGALAQQCAPSRLRPSRACVM